MDCALRGCALDEARLSRARVLDSVLSGVRGWVPTSPGRPCGTSS